MTEGEAGTEGAPDHQENLDLMVATARTLADHGIEGLTTQRVADEWGKSQPLVHYYYSTKEDLIVGFIEFIRDRTRHNYRAHRDGTPRERVEWILKRHFAGPHDPQDPGFSQALLEIQRHAANHERSRQALEDLDADAQRFLRDAIHEGIQDGTFRKVDLESTVTFLLSALNGGIQRVGLYGTDTTERELEEGFDYFIESVLVRKPDD